MFVDLKSSLITSLVICSFVATVQGAEVTYAQLQALAAQTVRDNDVRFSKPTNKIAGGKLWVRDAGPPEGDQSEFFSGFWFTEFDPLKEVLIEQMKIEARRQYLFNRKSNQEIMRPIYAQMEELLAGMVPPALDGQVDEERRQQRLKAQAEIFNLFVKGVNQCARAMGLQGSFVEPRDYDPEVWLDVLYAIYLPGGEQITYEQLRDAVVQAVRDKVVVFDMPKSFIEDRTFWVMDAGLQVEAIRQLDPLEEVIAEQVKIELRRAHLFQRPANRAIMEPVYLQMEAAIRRQLASLSSAGAASVAGRRPKSAKYVAFNDKAAAAGDGTQFRGDELPRSPFGRQLDDLLMAGLRRCAQRMGNLALEYHPRRLPTGIASVARVRLIAPRDTIIEYVYNTDRKLWQMTGKSEDDYAWQSAMAGDSVDLLGGYWFRLTYPDRRQASEYKRVGPNDTELRFRSR